MATKRIQQRKIQDYDPWYARLRRYVDFLLKCSYREIRYVGTERIPKDGAVIYAPNHTNALMDALVVLAMDRQPKVFVARADIFKNPTLAKIFHFLKIMPIMRIRDGFNEVKKNNETIEKAAEVLRDKVPFCIFPEGQHLAKHSALPLSKGIFRIALQAQEQLHEVPLYIVPVSLHYGNFFRFRSTVLVQIGHPIPVKEFMEEHRALSPQEQINLLKDLQKEFGITYLFISHDLSVVRYISDRICVMYLGNVVELGTAQTLFEDPRHPYTVALLSSIPTTDPDSLKKERILLEGNIPSPIKPPAGCKFHTRCYMACDKCKRVPPELREVEPGHFVACHFDEKKLDENGNYLFELPKMERKSNRDQD